jgi:hypothetical protein
MKKFFVNAIYICIGLALLFFDLEAQENTRLSGKLVKRYYPAPCIVKDIAFGWYLELDQASQAVIQKQFQLLSKEDRRIFKDLDIDLKMVQCVQCTDDVLLQVRSLEGKSITMEGRLDTPCLARKFLCFSIESEAIVSNIPIETIKNPSLDKFDYLSERFHIDSKPSIDDKNEVSLQLPEDVPEKLITLKGKLVLRLFPGPPEYTSIEKGDRADYSWMLLLDEESFKIATTTPVPEPANNLKGIMECSNHHEVSLSFEENMKGFCCDHENKEISVQGYLFHAHTAHHYSPILMNVLNASNRPQIILKIKN